MLWKTDNRQLTGEKLASLHGKARIFWHVLEAGTYRSLPQPTVAYRGDPKSEDRNPKEGRDPKSEIRNLRLNSHTKGTKKTKLKKGSKDVEGAKKS